MAKVDIKWKPGAWRKLRSEPGVKLALEAGAELIAQQANDLAGLKNGFRTSSQMGRAVKTEGRWRTTVITATAAAMKENAAENTLIKALGSVK